MSKAEENSDFDRDEPADPADSAPASSEWAVPGIAREAVPAAEALESGEWFDIDAPIIPRPVAPKRSGTVLSASSAHLQAEFDALTAHLNSTLVSSDMRTLTDDALLHVTSTVEHFHRHVAALQVAAAGELAHRSDKKPDHTGLAERRGSRNARELVQRLTQVSNATAGHHASAGRRPWSW